MSRDRLPFLVLVGWSVFLWLSRLRNVLADDDLSTAGVAWRIAVVVLFVGLAGIVVVAWRSGRPRFDRAVRVLVVWTVVFWLVRGVGILLDANHDAGFKAVHTVLMAVSIGVAAWAWIGLRRLPSASSWDSPSPSSKPAHPGPASSDSS